MTVSYEEFKRFADEIKSCKLCFGNQKKFCDVPYYREDPELFMIGQAPSLYRTSPGYAFGGRSREVFAQILKILGTTRERVYITNLVKCTIPGKEAGNPSLCIFHLQKELEMYNPEKVILFGREVVNYVLGGFKYPLSVHSLWKDGRQYIILRHPMVAVYRPDEREKYFHQVAMAKRLLEERRLRITDFL